MPDFPSTILTEDHLKVLKNAIDQGAAIQREIDLAKRAGIDVSAAEALLQDTLGKIRQSKSVYFPGT